MTAKTLSLQIPRGGDHRAGQQPLAGVRFKALGRVAKIRQVLIAAPFNEQACLRAARALEAMGITDARVAESAA